MARPAVKKRVPVRFKGEEEWLGDNRIDEEKWARWFTRTYPEPGARLTDPSLANCDRGTLVGYLIRIQIGRRLPAVGNKEIVRLQSDVQNVAERIYRLCESSSLQVVLYEGDEPLHELSKDLKELASRLERCTRQAPGLMKISKRENMSRIVGMKSLVKHVKAVTGHFHDAIVSELIGPFMDDSTYDAGAHAKWRRHHGLNDYRLKPIDSDSD